MARSNKKHTAQVPAIILLTGKFLSKISQRLTVRFLARLFTTPIRHKMPKREIEMYSNSSRTSLHIEAIGKEIVVYQYGVSPRKVLLVHGWSGRGTQLVKIADLLLKAGFSTVSFDAPAHGKSTGKTTLMPEFIAAIAEINQQYGPFEAAVGHSLGGMSLLNSVSEGFAVKRLVTIGSGDIVSDIMDDFVGKIKLQRQYSQLMREHFERQSLRSMESYSAYLAASKINIPVLVIHDSEDLEVPLKCAIHIHKHLKYGKLMVTKHLGHRKILGNDDVLQAVLQFIQNDNYEKDMRADHPADQLIM